MTGTAGKTRRSIALAAAMVVGPVVTLTAGPVSAALPKSQEIAASLRAGTLGSSHGVHDICQAEVDGRTIDLGCHAQLVGSGRAEAGPLTTSAPAGYGPAELNTAYRLPPLTTGPAATVAIVGVGAYPALEADLGKYRAQYGLPKCDTANGCLTVTDFKGGPPLQPSPGYAQVEESYAAETALDIDMASAACPTCKLVMVQIPLDIGRLLSAAALGLPAALADDFGSAVTHAAKLGAGAVSMSYGLPTGLQAEYVGTGAPAKALHHPGMAVVASSGDKGYNGDKQLWPAQLPWVTAAGGVSLKTGDHGAVTMSAWGGKFVPKGAKEPKWVGAGSGCAPGLPPAIGQPASVSVHCGNHRAVADISADADPLTGVAVYDSYTPHSGTGGGWLTAGGTSAAAPYLAGLYARGGHLAAVDGPNTLYRAPAGTIQDVAGGGNAQDGAAACKVAKELCLGGTGWDGPTGLGVPNGLGAF
ncbi:S8 family serine peptidase [Amycolatopsis sp. NPDC059027]|uniref:S8 family serine peptidase n=1 Tax=Amycolatopsis sp. NPDC059027 TaxID=3346709 RepID=UPI00366C8592